MGTYSHIELTRSDKETARAREARRMASTVARCIVSLGSKIRPRYSNWETSRIGYERGSEVGKGEYT